MENLEKIEMTKDELNGLVSDAVKTAKDDILKTKDLFNIVIPEKVNTTEHSGYVLGAYILAKTYAKEYGVSLQESAKRYVDKYNTPAGGIVVKTINETTDADGAIWNVPGVSSSFAEMLHAASVIRQLPIKQFNASEDNINIYRNTTGCTVFYDDELRTTGTLSTPQFGKHSLAMKNMTAFYKISKIFLNNGGAEVERRVQEEIVRAFAAKEDYYYLFGTGLNSQHKGIINWMAGGNKIDATDTNAETVLADLSNAVLKVASDKASNNANDFRWLIPLRTLNSYRALRNTTTGEISFPELFNYANPSLLGYPVQVTNNIPLVMTGLTLTGGADTAVFFLYCPDFEVYDRTGVTFEVNPPNNQITQYPGENLIMATKRNDVVLLHDTGAAVIYGTAK